MKPQLPLRFFVSVVLAAFAVLAPIGSLGGDPGGGIRLNDRDVVPVAISQDLSRILLSNPFMQGLTVVNTETNESLLVSTQAGAGQYASFSPDGRFVCYKGFQQTKGGLMQVPMLYDIEANRQIALAAAAPLAGTPAVAPHGEIAYTVANMLYVRNASMRLIRVFDTGHHVNLLAFSPDGRRIAYNDPDGQIIVRNLKSGAAMKITDGKACYWNPQFSPDAANLLLQTVGGEVVVAERSGRGVKIIGEGDAPAWVDSGTVAYTNRKAIEGDKVLETRVIVAGLDGGPSSVAAVEPGDASVVAASAGIALSAGGQLKYGYLDKGTARLAPLAAPTLDVKLETRTNTSAGILSVVDYGTYVRIDGVPYLHQVYDTPDYWNGNSSCGASAALMAIQYYSKLPVHPMNVSYPSPHVSDYGWYVPEIYTFNGYTYNIMSRDPNRTRGYGAFGYITQNNWEDTKTHMAELINQHGPTSSVDWSPTFAKAAAEVDQNTPFVLLNSLTTAGHYITGIGYYKAQYTLIFNDPYGNKNVAYPSVDGRNVCYDWPGYNNGYMNLNTVHCYIYCRDNPLPPPPIQNVQAGNISDSAATITWTTTAASDSVVEYGLTTAYGSTASDGAMVTNHTIVLTDLAAATTYHYRVQSTDASNNTNVSGDYTFTTLQSGQVADIIIDNPAATVVGSWSSGTSSTDKYGADYRYKSQGTGTAYLQFTPNVQVAGLYQVYEWHPVGTNRTTAAPHVVNYSGGTQTVSVNQQVNGGKWNLLGTWSFAAGTAGNVLITDAFPDGTQVVLADAIKLVYVGQAGEVPAAPSNLAAAVISKSQINLTWSDNSTNEANFVVEYRKQGVTTWTVAATLAANTTSYSKTGLTRNTTYEFQAKATNAAGSSAYSNIATAKTLAK